MSLLLGASIRVFIADDHPIFIAGLRALLDDIDEIEIVGEATSPTQAIRLILQTRPDIAVVDVSMSGISVAEQITGEAPEVGVICLSAHEDGTHVRHAIAAGARGYVLKRSGEQHLGAAIEAVSQGGLYVDPAIASRFVSVTGAALRHRQPNCRGKRLLTDRERDVLRLIALGFTNKEVAAKLGVTAKSVETYKTRASVKLDIHSRSKIVQYAILQGWFHEVAR
jgi:DNA-binding NarL/FixJ family response regulator